MAPPGPRMDLQNLLMGHQDLLMEPQNLLMVPQGHLMVHLSGLPMGRQSHLTELLKGLPGPAMDLQGLRTEPRPGPLMVLPPSLLMVVPQSNLTLLLPTMAAPPTTLTLERMSSSTMVAGSQLNHPVATLLPSHPTVAQRPQL